MSATTRTAPRFLFRAASISASNFCIGERREWQRRELVGCCEQLLHTTATQLCQEQRLKTLRCQKTAHLRFACNGFSNARVISSWIVFSSLMLRSFRFIPSISATMALLYLSESRDASSHNHLPARQVELVDQVGKARRIAGCCVGDAARCSDWRSG